MAEISDQKSAARKVAFAARKLAHGVGGATAALAARDRFLAADIAQGAGVIAGYRPIRTEIDPTPLMDVLHGAGARLCVPVIRGEGQPLSFTEWWPGVALEPGPFGAEVPVGTPYLVPDLLIAPLVAFDRGCWRLGYGGGFYDRSLVEIRATKPARAVGFAYGAQELDRIPREATDQRLDGVVTEAEVILPDG